MAWRVAKSLDVLLKEVDTRWPGRPKQSDGTIGDKNHQARNSDHNPWCLPPRGGVVTARDITEWVTDGVEMNDVLAEHLRARRDPRIKYVISDGRMFSSYPTRACPPWTWRKYSGTNAHTKHVHVSVQSAPGLYDSKDPWGLLGPTPPPPPAEDDDMTPQDKSDIINGVTANLLAQLQPSEGVDQQIRRIRRSLRKVMDKLEIERKDGPDGDV